jgi:hypothetical protein
MCEDHEIIDYFERVTYSLARAYDRYQSLSRELALLVLTSKVESASTTAPSPSDPNGFPSIGVTAFY